MALTHNIAHILTHMRENLVTAGDLVTAIEAEYEMNGNDSLANIDYGASLNTILTRLNAQFAMLDESELFTMGGGE